MNNTIYISLENNQNNQVIQRIITDEFGAGVALTHWRELSTTPPCDDKNILITDYMDASFEHVVQNYADNLTVILCAQQSLSFYINWFKQFKIKNQIIQTDDEKDWAEELLTTLRKITSANIFGLDQYISSEIQVIQNNLSHTKEMPAAISEVLDFIEPLVKNPKFKHSIKLVLDELLSNAFYNAPIDENGQRLYQETSRDQPIALPEDKSIGLQYGYDGNHLILEIRDAFGSLDETKLVDTLIHYFNNDLKVQSGTTGAGLGFSMVFRNTSRLIINIEKNKYTEIIAFLDINVRYREFQKQPASLNMFVV